ncbi:TIGR02281 family clan AA aspartic protease [Methylobacterium sp. BTF04]|uniref:retropepsin-like aspartic protease family protein n=1 Tax=Methylobacterium sp. BTF04 TaxID=2708300 RepID=UPI0013D5CCAF|nr:TIGR02281 family clan AA aspartic protease [Methylobacterium sp. BTF04]NEU10881.1 TIGR02281 family clan AA aspartic protease [Methylobacterium sp. BTF04]
MTRPIVWALGVTGVAALWGVSIVSKIDRVAPAVETVQTRPDPARAGAAPANEVLRNALTLFADGGGHFAADATIDGAHLRMLLDTGATVCTFTYEDAQRAGLRFSERDFSHPIQTANGTILAATVRIGTIRVGTITVQAVDAVVMPRGRLATSLLGMSFLRRLSEFSMANGRLTLRG